MHYVMVAGYAMECQDNKAPCQYGSITYFQARRCQNECARMASCNCPLGISRARYFGRWRTLPTDRFTLVDIFFQNSLFYHACIALWQTVR